MSFIDGHKYSMFPLETPDDIETYKFYETQQEQLWLAKEVKLAEDRKQFDTLPLRYKQLYCDLLAFFAPGDGLVNENIQRFARESRSFTESSFFDVQTYIERVHSEAYSLAITSVIPDNKTQEEVFNAMENIPCVRAKADFLKKYITSNIGKRQRYLAAACSEGIFFVTLFAIIFYMRSKNIMPGFILLNEQVSKDETLHKRFYCYKVKNYNEIDTQRDIYMKNVYMFFSLVLTFTLILVNTLYISMSMMVGASLSTYADKTYFACYDYIKKVNTSLIDHGCIDLTQIYAERIVSEAVDIEIDHLNYILREWVDSEKEDTIHGLTKDNLAKYAKMLGNQILVESGFDVMYNDVDVDLPWLRQLGLSNKTNFYEDKPVNYRLAGADNGNQVDDNHLDDIDF